MDSIRLHPDLELLQQQVARFIEREVEPYAGAWDAIGSARSATSLFAVERGMPVERPWRESRVRAIGGGATEVMLDEAARRY
jgi:alkylation response protein AidB-like acyl-CoA dehydrogenase